ncbi:MAG TPA: CAP domain-containing protein, partial [Candidatus Eisenbacteria bacterium]
PMRQSIVHLFARLSAFAVLVALPLACGNGRAATAHSVLSPARSPTPSPSSGPTDPEVVSFVSLMNAHRVSLGLSPLIWDRRAAAVAQAHSRDMLDRGYFSHVTPDGLTTWDRLAAGGVTYSEAGENIAWGQSTGSAALTAWLGSAGHKANIEHSAYTRHGVGKAGTYWTHVFIRTRTRASARR